MDIGYDRPLYILPFDHRDSFEKGLFGFSSPLTTEQTATVAASKQVIYDHDLRPSLMIAAIKELQNAGVEPDVWKIEGLDRRDNCAAVVTAAQRDGRGKVSCIILGRGSNEAGILAWLRAAAPLPGFIGFAVGRTTIWDALVALRDNKTTREKAVEPIANRYVEWVRVFQYARKGT